MKKNFFKGIALAAFALVSTSAMAQKVTISDLTVENGNKAAATISLDSEGKAVAAITLKISGDQLDNEKIKLVSIEAVEGAFPNGAEIDDINWKANKSRYVQSIYEKKAEAINDGEILNFFFEVAEDVAQGEYEFTSETSVSANDENVKLGDIAFKVTVGSTGIEAIQLIENNAPVYNLAGMLMNGNLQKGIYVQNGKKYIVK